MNVKLKEGFQFPTNSMTSVGPQIWQCAPDKSKIWLSSVILTAIILRLSGNKSMRAR